jgi:uncharacterized membrane-anchored protein YitT (DUF2179 family)
MSFIIVASKRIGEILKRLIYHIMHQRVFFERDPFVYAVYVKGGISAGFFLGLITRMSGIYPPSLVLLILFSDLHPYRKSLASLSTD